MSSPSPAARREARRPGAPTPSGNRPPQAGGPAAGHGRGAVPAAVLALLLLGAGPGAAQRVFDWTPRASVEPEALLSGGAAVLWNPAGISPGTGGRSELWVANLDAPDVTGVEGIAVSATRSFPLVGAVGISYQHVGTGDIPSTTTSPAAEGPDISVDEDLFVFGVARRLGSGAAGIGVRYVRASRGRDVRDEAALDAGINHPLPLPLSPRLALALRGLGTRERWLAGLSAGIPLPPNNPVAVRVSYGAGGPVGDDGREDRLAAVASWKDILHLGVGVTRVRNGNDWTPLWMLGADVGPYSLSILRESLANDFGAAEHYRLSVRLP